MIPIARPRLLLLLMLLALGLGPKVSARGEPPAAPSAAQAQLFKIDDRLPETGYLSTHPAPIPEDLIAIPILSRQTGLIAPAQARAFVTLNRFAEPLEAGALSTQDQPPIAYLHFSRGSTHRVVGIAHLDDEHLLLTPLDEPVHPWSLRADLFERLELPLGPPVLRASVFADRESDVLELPRAHVQSPTLLDLRTVKLRIKQSYPPLTRVLGQETFRVRLPKGFEPDKPIGVLVWISPSPDGRIPEIFYPVCDELGLIAIGIDNNGNQRAITDRLQNHLDSIETLAQYCPVDRQRVYVTGMSGGGRCASILQLAFPDLFAGAVPIVGLDTYHNAPTGNGGQYWPRRLAKPSGKYLKMLRDRRIAAITGTTDFNEPEMAVRGDLLERDGIPFRLDIIEGMSHAMPSAEQFAVALRWVDQPRREEIASSTAAAVAALSDYKLAFGDAPPTSPAARKALIAVIEKAPQSEPAWEAAGLLGFGRDP